MKKFQLGGFMKKLAILLFFIIFLTILKVLNNVEESNSNSTREPGLIFSNLK